MEDNGLSLESVFRLRGKAFMEIREHSAAIDGIAAAIADLDVALQTALDDRNIDNQQALVTSARHLAQLMEGGQA